jgi:hypothetical protein
MSRELARAILREIPLAQVEMYTQLLNGGVLEARAEAAKDTGNWCGAGCHDGLGHACGLSCAHAALAAGAFDVYGQSGLTRQDLENAIKNPAAFRRALGDELAQISRAVETGSSPQLGPKIDPAIFIKSS